MKEYQRETKELRDKVSKLTDLAIDLQMQHFEKEQRHSNKDKRI